MEPYRHPSYPAILGDLAYVAALALFVFLQKVANRLRAEENDTWWASNERDVVNGVAVIGVSAAVWLQGIAPHLALLFGATLTLTLSSLHAVLQHRRVVAPWRLVLVAAVVLGAPLVLVPQPVAEAAQSVLVAAFPR